MSGHLFFGAIKLNFRGQMKTSHLNALRALEAALRTGSFRAAADELGVTTAAVGQQIRGLEEYVGSQLFTRNPSGVVPTNSASTIATELSAGIGSLSSVLAELRRSGPDNRLSISMSLGIGEYWLTPRLPGFYAICDQFDLRIDTTHRLVDLQSEEFDFVLRFGPEPELPLESIFLFAGCVVPICTPEFADKYNLSQDTRSLTGVPVILVKKETNDPGWLDWESWSKECGIEYQERTTIPEFPRLSSGLRAAKEGLGVVLCGMVESFSALSDGSMIMPFGGSSATQSKFSYRLVSLCGRARSKTQNDFRNWMSTEAETYRHDVERLLGW
jgi:LysR family glycine cleavage system transcriptional activator